MTDYLDYYHIKTNDRFAMACFKCIIIEPN